MKDETSTGSYWDHKGKYQKQYDAAWKTLIPSSGEADDGLPEALRAITRVGYDYYNNGFCNLWQGHEDVDDYGDDYIEYTMDSYYEDMVDYLRYQIPLPMHRELEAFLLDAQGYGNWSDKDVVIDSIINHIMEQMIQEELIAKA